MASANQPRTGAPTCSCLDLLESSRRVLVQQAGDQGLVRKSLRQCPFLNCFQVLTREPDVQPPVLAERGLRVAGVARALTLASLGRLPLATFDGVEQLPFVSVHLHR